LHGTKAFSASQAALPASGMGVQEELGGDTAGQPADPGDVPEHATLCSATKAGEGGRRMFGAREFVFPSYHHA